MLIVWALLYTHMCIINCTTLFNVVHTQKVSNSSIFFGPFCHTFFVWFSIVKFCAIFNFIFCQFTNFFIYLPHSRSNYLKLKQQIDQNQFETESKKVLRVCVIVLASNGMNRLESLWVRDLLVVYLLCKQFLNDNISKCLNTKSSAKLKFVVFLHFVNWVVWVIWIAMYLWHESHLSTEMIKYRQFTWSISLSDTTNRQFSLKC